MVGVDLLGQQVVVGFAIVVVGNDETVGILGIYLLRAQIMPLHVEVIKVSRNEICTFTCYNVL